MTAKVQVLLKEVQGLSLPDQLELIHIMTLNLSRRYQNVSPQSNFGYSSTLEELIHAQHVKPITDIHELAADFWPEDESADDMIGYIYTQRQEDRENDYENPLA